MTSSTSVLMPCSCSMRRMEVTGVFGFLLFNFISTIFVYECRWSRISGNINTISSSKWCSRSLSYEQLAVCCVMYECVVDYVHIILKQICPWSLLVGWWRTWAGNRRTGSLHQACMALWEAAAEGTPTSCKVSSVLYQIVFVQSTFVSSVKYTKIFPGLNS